VGSGGPYARAAARALARHTSMDAGTLAAEALKIAGQICVYTNQEISVETL
jgi:ATP-dependent HslUV protease, peptidase subunit HslV